MKLLTIGVAHTLLQDVVYALPVRTIIIDSDDAGTLEISVDGITWNAIDSGAIVGSLFIRSTGDDSVVVLKVSATGFEDEDMALESVTITVSQADFRNLNSVPILLVAADPGNVLVPLRLIIQIDVIAGGFTDTGNMNVGYVGITLGLMQNVQLITTSNSGIKTALTQSTGATLNTDDPINRGLELFSGNDNDATLAQDASITLWFVRTPGLI